MGVMRCFRKNCDNILCERYSNRYGYICHECYREMLDKHMPISVFMNSEKGYDNQFNYEEEFVYEKDEELN